MTQRRLVLTQDVLEDAIQRRGRARMFRAGILRSDDREEWLVHRHRFDPASAGGPRVLVVHAPRRLGAIGDMLTGSVADVIVIFDDGGQFDVTPLDGEPFARLKVVGPGLPTVPLATGWGAHPSDNARTEFWAEAFYSRTRGALGEDVHEHLTRQHFAVLGTGRSGSRMAEALVHLGVAKVTLIDPDMVEPHNLGEMPLITIDQVGQSKSAAVLNRLRQAARRPDVELIAEPVSVESLVALYHIKRADILIGCVDNAEARAVMTFLASLYLKPLLDLGTGILDPEHGGTVEAEGRSGGRRVGRAMGADVRLVLPGRCLNCFGGIGGGRENGRRRRERPDDTGLERASDDQAWRLERAGSLLSLNGLAVHLGLRLLEDFLAGRVGESTWLHLEYDANSIPSIDHFAASDVPRVSCPTCQLTGLGDSALNHFRDVVGGGG